jgi:murein DD-endopeptidase MepM/ murein hydrolase activator NlpD
MSKPVRYSVLVLVVVALYFLLLRPGAAPTVEISASRPGVGRPGTTVVAHVRETDRGITSVRIEAAEDDQRILLAEHHASAPPAWAFWRRGETDTEVSAVVSPETFSGLAPGEISIRVQALGVGAALRGPKATIASRNLPVRFTSPPLSLTSTQNYVRQGGSGVVVYRLSEASREDGSRDGVEAGEWFFPGQPLPGSDGLSHFALYGVPYNLEDVKRVRLVAEDPLGNRTAVDFVDRFFPDPLHTDTIRLSVEFMEKVVPEILAQTTEITDTGDLLKNYLAINGDLRVRNAATLRDLGQRSKGEFLWDGAFLQLPNSKVMSAFADHRTYLFEGREVDTQDHLGFDLASVSSAPVPASNRGIVVMARYFGIYGNTVVLDHGFGLMSLYSHLSSIAVAEGREVQKGEVIGHTGQTGLAGGDHLHFTLLIHGLPVTPLEWWDRAWIRDRVSSKLGSALASASAR